MQLDIAFQGLVPLNNKKDIIPKTYFGQTGSFRSSSQGFQLLPTAMNEISIVVLKS